jgi:hypothetical protein
MRGESIGVRFFAGVSISGRGAFVVGRVLRLLQGALLRVKSSESDSVDRILGIHHARRRVDIRREALIAPLDLPLNQSNVKAYS